MTPPLSITHLRYEYLENPLGVDEARPRFGWQLLAAQRGTMQTAWQLRVATSPDALTRPLWDSGRATGHRG